jgi:peptidoglycan/LPS O-acetylase OafA/YrhL
MSAERLLSKADSRPLSKEQHAVTDLLDSIVAHRAGAFGLLVLAAFLEAFGDSLFQSGMYRSEGMARVIFFACGAVVLALYGFTVNSPPWDFGKLLGIYVVLFFLVAQVLAKVRFHQSPTMPIYVGGALITTGGIIIAFWPV